MSQTRNSKTKFQQHFWMLERQKNGERNASISTKFSHVPLPHLTTWLWYSFTMLVTFNDITSTSPLTYSSPSIFFVLSRLRHILFGLSLVRIKKHAIHRLNLLSVVNIHITNNTLSSPKSLQRSYLCIKWIIIIFVKRKYVGISLARWLKDRWKFDEIFTYD